MTATTYDDQRNNLVKFIKRCHISIILVKRMIHLVRNCAVGQFTPYTRATEKRVHEKALEDFHIQVFVSSSS